MKLWIVTVNFGDTAPTKSLIDSIASLDRCNSIKVVIADNASTKESCNELKKIIEKTKLDIKIISYKKNLYYWPAAKRVISNLKNSIGSYPDWIIVCNNDIIFPDKYFLHKLAKINQKKYPIIGPNIINSHGEKSNPFMISQLSRLEKFYWNLYFVSYPLSKFMLSTNKFFKPFFLRFKSDDIYTKKQVYAVHGSFILFSKSFFNRGGWLDDNFEMYGEEISVAEIAKKLNIPITYFDQLQIIHDEHKSTKIINNHLLFNKAKEAHKYCQSISKK